MLDVRFPQATRCNIKIIGVGGAGCNAVNSMYSEGIKDVFFAVCNTDYQDLDRSPVPCKIQLGEKLTNGLGCGANDEKGREAALESSDLLNNLLNDKCIVFVVAGMGGGTGTGAAPVIAKMAKAKGLLTIGIVTLPFKHELPSKIQRALKGLQRMSEAVDSLIVVNNQKLCSVYGNLTVSDAFNKANAILSEAARGISDIVSSRGWINVDVADVETILHNGRVAIVNSGEADGNDRVAMALKNALSSPLLSSQNIADAKKILINIYTSRKSEITIQELDGINNITRNIARGKESKSEEIIWGQTYTDEDSQKCKVTIIATGFSLDDVCDLQLYKDDVLNQKNLFDYADIDIPAYKKTNQKI